MRITINIDDQFGDEIKRLASSKGISISRLVAGVLEESLLREKKARAIRSVLDLANDEFATSEDALDLLEGGRIEDEDRI